MKGSSSKPINREACNKCRFFVTEGYDFYDNPHAKQDRCKKPVSEAYKAKTRFFSTDLIIANLKWKPDCYKE